MTDFSRELGVSGGRGRNETSRSKILTCGASAKLTVLLLVGGIIFLSYSRVQAQTGTVIDHQKISSTEGNFQGELSNYDNFTRSIACLGDLDRDGVVDIAVGAQHDDDGGGNSNRGAVWVLFLNRDGTVKSHQKISDTEGNFDGVLHDNDHFGVSVASLGDLNGDTVTDIAVGALQDDDGGNDRGAVWVLFLNDDGTVKSHQKISDLHGNFTACLDDGDGFGGSVASIGDFDGDDIGDIAVGAFWDHDAGTNRGAVWVLCLNDDGTVKSRQKINDVEGGFTGVLDDQDHFGVSIASLGDFDGDSVIDLAVGAGGDDDGGADRGAFWILFLKSDGTVKSQQKISDTEGDFAGVLDNLDYFGNCITCLGDLDGDSVTDLVVGATCDDDGAFDAGAVWVLFLNPDGTVKGQQKISDTEGNFTGGLGDSDAFGRSVTALGDLNEDGVVDIAVGAGEDDDGGLLRGAVWVLFLDGPPVIEVTVDIKPGSYPNAINLASHGLTPVAILSSTDFDARSVDPASIGLSGASVARRGKSGEKLMAHEEDVDGDGLPDIVVQVVTMDIDANLLYQEDGITYSLLTGSTYDGQPIEGVDEVTIVPPGQ